jgi:hypothetical protein
MPDVLSHDKQKPGQSPEIEFPTKLVSGTEFRPQSVRSRCESSTSRRDLQSAAKHSDDGSTREHSSPSYTDFWNQYVA